MNCDIFISYRRDGGDMVAMHVYQALKERGYQVFYDLEVLRAGKFNEALLDAIDACQDFVLILSPHALDRCQEEGDWVRREIAEALRRKKNIIPIMLNGFTFPKELPPDIEQVRFQNGLTATTEYFSESMDRLCDRYLTVKPKKQKKKWVVPCIACAAVVIALAAVFFALRGSGTNGQEGEPSPETTAVAVMETADATEVLTATPMPEATEVPGTTEASVVTSKPEIVEIEVSEVTEIPTSEEAAPEPAVSQDLSALDLPVLGYVPDELDEDFFLTQEDIEGAMLTALSQTHVFGSEWTRDQIHHIVFTEETAGDNAFDVTEDGSRMAWVQEMEGENTLFIQGPIRLPENASRLFGGYFNLRSLEWNGLADFSRVTQAGEMFAGCGELMELDLGGQNLISAEETHLMFFNCVNLQTLNLTGARFGSLRRMDHMFSACTKLQELDLSGFDTSSATEMSSLFSACASLKTLDFSGWDTSHVQAMGGMFSGCDSLTELDLSGFQTSRVTNMAEMFAVCRRLHTLLLGEIDTSRVTDMREMFNGDEQLEELDVSHFQTDRVISMNAMFQNCQNLLALDVSGFDTSRVTDFDGMFNGCVSLGELDLSGWNTERATSMARMFQNCTSLLSLDLSSFDTSHVTQMENMFGWMENVEQIDVHSFRTQSVISFTHMFTQCHFLRELDLSGFDTSSAETMDGMFQGDEMLESIGVDPATFGKGSQVDMFDGTPLEK